MSRFWLFFVSFISACSGFDEGPQDLAPSARPDRTLVYACDDIDFVLRITAEEVGLWLEQAYTVLEQVPTASGVKYQSADISVWTKGDEAVLAVPTRQYLGCLLQPAEAPWADARLREVDVRAVGNEPGWVLEIKHQQQTLFIGQYGSERSLQSTPEPVSRQGVVSYNFEPQGMIKRIELRQQSCVDTMSDQQAFPLQATVELRDGTLHGCARYLSPQ